MGAEFPPPQSYADSTSKIKYEEIEKVFELADDVYSKYASLKMRMILQRLFISIVPATFLCWYAAVLFQYKVFDGQKLESGFMILSAFFIIGFLLSIVAVMVAGHTPLGARLRAETRALHRVVSLLHELEQDIDGQSNWSPVQKAEFRIRVSRYVLPDYRPSFIERLYGLHR